MKEFFSSNINITNNRTVNKFITYEKVIILFGGNKDNFKKLYGKQLTTMRLTHRSWIWKQVVDGFTFYIFCSVKGTTYEISYPAEYINFLKDKKAGKASIKFLETICNDLQKLGVTKCIQ